MTRRALVTAVFLTGLIVLAAAQGAWAQLRPGKATVARVIGRVETLAPGQTQWTPASQGAQLSEGSQVRCFAGASAELTLPDNSTVLVAENTRYALTKLEADPQTGARNILSHVVVGKIRAQVQRAAVQLVRARQSNFAISTPSGVAAVRGTIVVLTYDPATNTGLLFVLPSPGQPAAQASASYLDFNTGTTRLVAAGAFVTHVAGQLPTQPAPISTLPPNVQQQVTAATNSATAGSGALTQPVVVIVQPGTIQQALVVLGEPGGEPTVPPTTPAATREAPPSAASPVGRDVQFNPVCASPPCPFR